MTKRMDQRCAILGIHDGHNASACLLEDGVLTRAVQEERFTLVKNQGGFPYHSVRWILDDAGVEADEIDYVVFGHYANWTTASPTVRAEIVESYTQMAESRPRTTRFRTRAWGREFLKRIGLYEKMRPAHHGGRLGGLIDDLSSLRTDRIVVLDHHLCHAASALYGGPWAEKEVLVLTLDGSGDGKCATVYVGTGGRLRLLAATPAGNSLGNIYSRTTHLMGFVPLEHEYKLMGMAPYADQDRAAQISAIFESYLEVDDLVFKRRIPEPTGFIGKRLREDLKYVRFDLIAAGLQLFTERMVLTWVKNAIERTGIRTLCLAGGAFMNVKANGLIANSPDVENVFVCPSCGDESLSLGAAYEWYARIHDYRKHGEPLGPLYLGPDIGPTDGEALMGNDDTLKWERPADIPGRVAELLAQGHIVARCDGRSEFGARALGNRSIFADPSNPFVVRTLNNMIKMRDFWMPFAPIVLEDRQERYLRNPKSIESPYMMFAFDTYVERFREIIAAIQPVDRSGRPEILKRGHNLPVERMLEVFERLTGRAMLLNTSYNIHGEPMVCSALQALDVLQRSGLRHLWLGSYLVSKIGGGQLDEL